ncbi:MAG: M48 family metallopeptidase [Planctomycetaceae bacterium]|nr:M48 family metallopeptidase [Planctomycetaceae bacterium]
MQEPTSQHLPSKSSLSFPRLSIEGPEVDPHTCIEPGTGFALTLGYLVAGFGLFVIAASTMGFGLIFLLIAPLVNYFNRKKALALIHGSGIKIGPEQFPELHKCVETLWGRVGNGASPEVYIIEDSVMNAFAVRYGKRNIVLLTDDMIHGCLQSRDPRTLAFVVGHELAHTALKHHSAFRTWISASLKRLSRLDEYTADRVAMKLLDNPKVAAEGIVLLTVGPHLLPYINYDALEIQVQEVVNDRSSRKAERQLTHPLLLHRLDRALG